MFCIIFLHWTTGYANPQLKFYCFQQLCSTAVWSWQSWHRAEMGKAGSPFLIFYPQPVSVVHIITITVLKRLPVKLFKPVVSSLMEGLHWKWLWAGKGGSRRWGWEAGFGLRSGITSSHWSCQVYSTQRYHTCSRHRVRRGLIQLNDLEGFWFSSRNET